MQLALSAIRYWREGLLALMALALFFGHRHYSGALEDKRNELAACNAARELQNAHVERLKADGDRLRAEVEAARSEGERDMDKARNVKERLEKIAPIGCSTPREILEADI